MKRLNRWMLAGFLLLATAAVPMGAAAREGEVYVVPFAGGYTFDGAQSLDTAPVYGLRLGYGLTERLGVEAVGDTLSTEFENGGDVQVTRYGLDLVYDLWQGDRLVPFVGGGFSGISVSPDGGDTATKGIFNYGIGLKYLLGPGALRFDLRHLVLSSSTPYSNLEYTLGYVFPLFGGAAPVAAAVAPADSDRDGIIDALDRCPGTPAGTKVDADGCPPVQAAPAMPAPVPAAVAVAPLDSDGDGVIDEQDRCPGTPVGIKVDAAGCPLDSDGDGVTDDRDACPDTRSGLAVDSKGCPPPIEEKLKITLNVKFASGKADIDPKYVDDLKKVGDFMTTYPGTTTVIEGHTDSQGAEAANKALSQRRADNVRKYLIDTYKLDPARITAVGYGEERPIADNATAEGRQQNRRIEATFETVVKKAAQ